MPRQLLEPTPAQPHELLQPPAEQPGYCYLNYQRQLLTINLGFCVHPSLLGSSSMPGWERQSALVQWAQALQLCVGPEMPTVVGGCDLGHFILYRFHQEQ